MDQEHLNPHRGIDLIPQETADMVTLGPEDLLDHYSISVGFLDEQVEDINERSPRTVVQSEVVLAQREPTVVRKGDGESTLRRGTRKRRSLVSNEGTRNPPSLLTPALRQPKAVSTRKPREKWKCIECEKPFDTASILNIHLKKKHGIVKLPVASHYCRQCGMTWSCTKAYYNHFKDH